MTICSDEGGVTGSTVQVQPVVKCRQSCSQPSPSTLLPSSHTSLPNTRPSPQNTFTCGSSFNGSGSNGFVAGLTVGSGWQVGPQPSPATGVQTPPPVQVAA